jgi:Leucine-rich repeat (LRR) protein
VSAAVLTEEKNKAKTAYTGLLGLSCKNNSPTLTSEVFKLNYLLSYLNINDCSLTSLPDEIGELLSLRELVCASKSLTCLPSTIGKAKRLKKLQLEDCTALTSLPNSIGELKELEILSLICCPALTALPNSIGELQALQNLELMSLQVTALPESIGRLQKLQSLNLNGCLWLSELPNSIVGLGMLREVCTVYCRLRRIPGYVFDPNGTVVWYTDELQMRLRSYLPGLRLMLVLVLAMRRKKMKRALPELFEWLWREFIEPQP